MKKFILLLAFWGAVFCLYAQNSGDEGAEAGRETAEKESGGFVRSLLGYLDNPRVTSRHLDRKRIFELRLSNLEVEFGNNLIGLRDIFKRQVLIDFDELNSRINDKGLGLNMGFGFMPLWININPGQRWGGGFGLNSMGRFDVNIPKEFLDLIAEGNENHRKSSGEFVVSGGAFVEIGLNTHATLPFLNGKLSLGLDPAFYIPMAYIPRSGINYTLDTTDRIMVSAEGRFLLYMPLNLDSINVGDIFGAGGVDFSLSAEYALFSRLDLGLSVSHIPLAPAHLSGGYEFNLPYTTIIDIDDVTTLELDNLIEAPELTGGGDFVSLPDRRIFRPLRFDFYHIFRPFYNDILSVRPNIGFTVLNASEKTYFNMGIRATMTLARLFALYVDSGREEGLWQHKLGFELNLRAFELDMEAGLRSQSYRTSWMAAGAVVKLGIAFGF